MDAGAPDGIPTQQAVENYAGYYIHIVLHTIGIFPGNTLAHMSLDPAEQVMPDPLVEEQVNHSLVRRTFHPHLFDHMEHSVIPVDQLHTQTDT